MPDQDGVNPPGVTGRQHVGTADNSGPNSDASTYDSGPTQSSRPKFVVAIGASAGGLEPLEVFFERVPPVTGLAFVVIQHLSPDFKSLMDEILARRTTMAIHRVEQGMPIASNAIYLIPPKKEMSIEDGRFVLTDQDRSGDVNLPINIFFNSMAEQYGERSIAIVMSGTGSDGSRGVQSVRAVSGLTIAQDPASAAFEAMPNSAIHTGAIDWVLPADQMVESLMRYVQDPAAERQHVADEAMRLPASDGVSIILNRLRTTYGIDFSHYKTTTVSRRIERRIQMAKDDSVDEYAQRIVSDAAELNSLYCDLLIGVTRFFRDPAAFQAVEREVLPSLLDTAAKRGTMRVWIAGCATGEEAYSLAILIDEHLRMRGDLTEVKIFATDVHRTSLEYASTGLYPEEGLSNLNAERKARYFTREGDFYRISKDLRRMIVFAPHNLLNDAPFTRMDLVSCRNLLIYLRPLAQKKVLTLLHFALNAKGALLLGPSETAGDLQSEFEPLDEHWRLFRKIRDIKLTATPRLPIAPAIPIDRVSNSTPQNPALDVRLFRAYDQLLKRYVPAGILVNEHYAVVHSIGQAAQFLHPPEGRVSLNILDMVNTDLRIVIASGLQRAFKENRTVAYDTNCQMDDDTTRHLLVTVHPLPDTSSQNNYAFIQIEDADTPKIVDTASTVAAVQKFDLGEVSKQRILSLNNELQQTKEHLQTTIEELETSNEELQATNEELVSSNEELQSTNEELHSVNEELYTVNSEYQRKISELTELTNDMDNLMASTDIGTLFLDRESCIRRFTPAVGRAVRLRPQDIGRPISDIAHTFNYDNLQPDIEQVLSRSVTLERELKGQDGTWFLMRISPYRTRDDAIEGVVISFVDLTGIKKTEAALRESESLFREMAEQISEVFWMASADGRKMLYVSPAFQKIWGRSPEPLYQNATDWMCDVHTDDRERVLRGHTERASDAAFDEEFRIRKPDGEVRWLRNRGFPILDDAGGVRRVAGITQDITRHKQVEERFRTIVAGFPMAAIMIDLHGDITLVNRIAENLFGYRSEELLGQPIELLIPERFKAAHLQHRASFVATPSIRVMGQDRIVAGLRKDGSEIEVEVGLSVIETDLGQSVMAAIADVSSRRDAERAVRMANNELKTANQEMEQLLYSVSHDLKSPLVTLQGFSSHVTRDVVDNRYDRLRDFAGHIADGVEKMRVTIDDLLEVSRVGRAVHNPEPLSIDELLSEWMTENQERIHRARAAIRVQKAIPEIVADRYRMQQIVDNLLTNAIKYGCRGDNRSISVRTQMQDDEIWFIVSDQGPGIDPAYHDKVFRLFERLHHDTEGSGVGLNLVKRAAEFMNGRVWVESERGKGSSFFVALPKSNVMGAAKVGTSTHEEQPN